MWEKWFQRGREVFFMCWDRFYDATQAWPLNLHFPLELPTEIQHGKAQKPWNDSVTFPFGNTFLAFFLSERIKKLHLSSHYLVVVEEKITDSAGARLTPALEAPPQSPQIQIQTDVRLHLPGRKHAHFKQKQAIFFLAHKNNSAHRSETQPRHCLQTGFVNFCKLFAIHPEKAAATLPHHLNKRVVPSGTPWI